VTTAIARPADLDRAALVTWAATRIAVAVLVLAAMWMVVDSSGGHVPSWLAAWNHWDVDLYVKVAKYGYQGAPEHYSDQGIVAFFPGEPLALRAVHVVVRSWVASGLLISAVAGAVAAVALARLAALEAGRGAGSRAVLYLTLSPFAVFLAAGYSESLFLAFALWSWLAARQRRWLLAGVLAGASASVRITGVFLGAALLVQWLGDRDRARLRSVVPLLLPFAVTAAYFGYLRAITGDWLAWPHAQADQWGRRFTAPWTALSTTWSAAFGDGGQGAAYIWSFRAEILAVFLGLLLCVALLLARRWGELTYVGLQLAGLATSSFYLSVARATLLWWPLWLLLARAAGRHTWVHPAYLSVAPPLMAAGVVAFVQGHWVG